MSVFHEVSLPLAFSLGASGGLERRVEIVSLASGREARNTPWANGRRHYDVGGTVRTLDDLHTLVAFFEARRGSLHAFRLRDPFDHKSCAPSVTVSPLDQELGVGDGATAAFSLRKAYADAASAYHRPIAKPVPGSIRIAVAGVEQSGFAVDAGTGVVTLPAAPTAGQVVSAGFLFDTPVRFDAERLDLSLDGFGAGRAVAVPLIEVML